LIDAFKGTTAPAPHSFVGHFPNDAPVGKKTEKHAMALVGWRKREDGKILFLVQNWWKGKQLFECDLEFLRSRHASLVWITAELMKLPDKLPRTYEAYEESELTGEDCTPEEGYRVRL
jgi:hypothetical protein